jgi:antagonist of KipI
VRPALRVIEPGPLTTVQDLGRFGYQALGVPVAGAMDPWALRALNRLVGNVEGAAGLEATLAGPTLVVEAETGDAPLGLLVALGGAEADATADGVPVPPYRATWLPAGARLAVGAARRGARPLLAVAGGIDVPPLLGSRSTSLRGGFGGHQGRPLATGDRLPVGPVEHPSALPARDGLMLPPPLRPPLEPHVTLRVVLGPQADHFTDEALATLLNEPYRLAPESDRMGARLAGPTLAHRRGADIVSDGTTAGSIQVPESGLPIILLADRPVTGGYAKIATVISSDLPKLTQLPPGGTVRFEAVDLAAAHAAEAEAEASLTRALAHLVRHEGPPPWAASPRLLATNLVSGVTAGDAE